jgi:hypothetical protein
MFAARRVARNVVLGADSGNGVTVVVVLARSTVMSDDAFEMMRATAGGDRRRMAVPSARGRQGSSEGVEPCRDRATATLEDICNRAFPALFCPRRYTMGGARCGAMPSSDIVEVRATVSAARFGANRTFGRTQKSQKGAMCGHLGRGTMGR